jgi:hypothetical protein
LPPSELSDGGEPQQGFGSREVSIGFVPSLLGESNRSSLILDPRANPWFVNGWVGKGALGTVEVRLGGLEAPEGDFHLDRPTIVSDGIVGVFCDNGLKERSRSVHGDHGTAVRVPMESRTAPYGVLEFSEGVPHLWLELERRLGGIQTARPGIVLSAATKLGARQCSVEGDDLGDLEGGWNAVFANHPRMQAEVQVTISREACLPHRSQALPRRHLVAHLHHHVVQVGIEGE